MSFTPCTISQVAHPQWPADRCLVCNESTRRAFDSRSHASSSTTIRRLPSRPCSRRSIHELTAAVNTRLSCSLFNAGLDVSNTIIGLDGSNRIVDSLSNMPDRVPPRTIGAYTRAAAAAAARANAGSCSKPVIDGDSPSTHERSARRSTAASNVIGPVPNDTATRSTTTCMSRSSGNGPPSSRNASARLMNAALRPESTS